MFESLKCEQQTHYTLWILEDQDACTIYEGEFVNMQMTLDGSSYREIRSRQYNWSDNYMCRYYHIYNLDNPSKLNVIDRRHVHLPNRKERVLLKLRYGIGPKKVRALENIDALFDEGNCIELLLDYMMDLKLWD